LNNLSFKIHHLSFQITKPQTQNMEPSFWMYIPFSLKPLSLNWFLILPSFFLVFRLNHRELKLPSLMDWISCTLAKVSLFFFLLLSFCLFFFFSFYSWLPLFL
jgi:hypothetical protein